MTIHFKTSIFSPLLRHPSLVGLVAGLGLILWAGIIAYGYFVSPSPTEADIAGQTVQLNVTGLQTITDRLTTFRTPGTLPPVQNTLFTPTAP